jgi:hypothetical protein
MLIGIDRKPSVNSPNHHLINPSRENTMKNPRTMGIARLALYTAITTSLAACGHSAPSDGDVKGIVESRIAGCTYLTLKDFKKTNGIPGDDPNSYRIEVEYTMHIEPTDDQKDSLKHWLLDADQMQKLNASYMQQLKSDDADGGANRTQHIEEYGDARSKLQTDMQRYLSTDDFYNKVSQDCSNVDRQFIHSFYAAARKFSDYTKNGIDSTFTGTIPMVKTDNGWQEAR